MLEDLSLIHEELKDKVATESIEFIQTPLILQKIVN